MADRIPPTATSDMEEPQRPPPGAEPPPLDAVRVKGASGKGLNKPAIVVTTGAGVAIVLVLASGAFSSGTSRKPAETRPVMSDPARPEMAQGAIRSLPATYSEAAARAPSPVLSGTPQLGPPLPGDVGAFAQADPPLRGRYSEPAYDWDNTSTDSSVPLSASVEDEEKNAERSAIFFALREEPQGRSPTGGEAQARTPPSALGADQLGQNVLSFPSGDRALFPGAIIPASLVTELNSESPGPVVAQVTQAIYDSVSGRNLLIPQGTRLIGEYKSSTRYGQSRVAITWQRLIMPDGVERALDEAAVSPSGAAGVGGDVDNHWADVFGAAALGTLINVGVATTEDAQITFSGVGAVSRDPVDQAVQDGVERTASTVTNRVVDRGLAIPPTVRVQAGARIYVIVTRRNIF